MTDQPKTFEFRCRGRIRVKSRKDAKASLNVSNVLMFAKMDTGAEKYDVYLTLDNIELLGEVEGE